MSSLEERFSTALHNTARSWRLAVDRRLKHLGLSQAGWMTIAIVAKSASPLSQIELAQRVGVEGATMVAMLDRLERTDLITRSPSAVDRRVKHVRLTRAGSVLYEQVRHEADAVRRQLLAHVDSKGLREATTLLEGLLTVIERLP